MRMRTQEDSGSSSLQARDPSRPDPPDVGEEAEVAGVTVLMRVGSALVGDGAQGAVSSDSEILEHQGMLVL